MAKVKCEYCGSFIDDSEEKCPNCGAVNKNYKRYVADTPKTIEELKGWYEARKLPPEQITRFFIGKDIKQPRAFGIYKDGSNYIVYKNKADGKRSIRYEGKDEAYAVNELYMKLKSEILNQRNRSLKKGIIPDRKKSSFNPLSLAMIISGLLSVMTAGFFVPAWLLIVLFVMLAILAFLFRKDLGHLIISMVVILLLSTAISFVYMVMERASHSHDGYYSHNNNYYYFQGNDVYNYDDGWNYYDSYDSFSQSHPDYTYVSKEYIEDEYYSDFSQSEYYDGDWSSSSNGSSSSSYDYDSDYDWDSGSDWDSGGTDWDSDW